jgi:GcrA cell cycle regulator
VAWTPPQEEKLRELWLANKSASQIAEEIAPLAKPGKKITRDMVIGKARRMGLDPRPSPIKRSAAA